jgi:hypothetical protein
MNFENPGGGLTFFSILWCLGGIGGIYFGVSTGSMTFAGIAVVILLASIGLWLQSQLAKYVLFVWFCCMMVIVTILLFVKGFTLLLFARGLLAAYCALLLYQWDGTSAD